MKPYLAGLILALALLLAACAANPPVVDPAPIAPTDVTATPGPGYITVQWEDNSDHEDGFVIYRDTITTTSATKQALQQVGEVPANTEEFVDRGIEPGEQYVYGVSAKGTNADSATTEIATSVSVEPGIDLSVGTYNLAPHVADAWTAFAFYFFLPEAEAPTEAVSVMISGPDGWNGGNDHQLLITPDWVASGWFWDVALTPAVAGDYTVSTTINNTAYSATAFTDASGVLPTAQNPSINSASTSSVAVSWDDVPGAQSYSVNVNDAPLRIGMSSFGWGTTTGTSVTIDGLSLPAGEYLASVFAFPIDRTLDAPLKPAEFNISLAVTDTFTLAAAGCVNPEPITDPNLAAAIQDDLSLSATPTCEDLLALTFFTADNRGISNLEGLQYALNIFDAELSDNAIFDVTALAPLVKMEKLHLNRNNITDLTPLANLTLLDTLTLQTNQISDLSPLLANAGLGEGDVIDVRDNPLDLSAGSSDMADIDTLMARGVSVLHDALVVIEGVWSTSLTATESTCEQVPVGTVATSDVTFETYLNQVTATNESGSVSTGTRFGNTVTLTRSDTAQWGEAYEVMSVSEWQEDSFTGESVYTLEGGCVITWDFAGNRIP